MSFPLNTLTYIKTKKIPAGIMSADGEIVIYQIEICICMDLSNPLDVCEIATVREEVVLRIHTNGCLVSTCL